MLKKMLCLSVILLLINSASFATDNQNKMGEMEGEEPHKMQSHESEKMSMGGTMGAVFTADELFTCPMHPEVVSADSEKRCPLCSMKLKAMTPEQVMELRMSKPRGCSMSAIVVKGDSKIETCPVCTMKLVEIIHPPDMKKSSGSSGENKSNMSDCSGSDCG